MAKSFAAVLQGATRTASGKSDSRRKLIGAVRAAAKRMSLDDDDRRAIQLEATGKASMADMNLSEIGKVLDRLNRDQKGRGIAGSAARPHVAKVKALWWTLYWLGAVTEASDAAMDAFVRRQTGIASLRFLDHRKAPSVIEALKSIAARNGVRWPVEKDNPMLVPANIACGLTIQRLERHAVIEAIWRRMVEHRIVYGDYYGYVRIALGLSLNHTSWTDRELDEAIRMLGKKLRRKLGASLAQEVD